MTTALVHHPDFLAHATGSHPECQERLLAITAKLQQLGFWERVHHLEVPLAERDLLISTHPAAYLERLEAMANIGGGMWDPDTVVSPGSYRAACRAAGGVMAAVQAVLAGEHSNAVCLMRPPGHHAEPANAMGFCLLNNVAVGANYALTGGLERIAILDWDVHHGNGTQKCFYNDPRVLYLSVHQSPLFPGTGKVREMGNGPGTGYTINVPLPAGCGDETYYFVFEQALAPVLRQFGPQLILVSAGYDAHFSELLASMRVSLEGFRRMGQQALAWAQELCSGRLVVVLEGGYRLDVLAWAISDLVAQLAGFPLPILPEEKIPPVTPMGVVREHLQPVFKEIGQHWGIISGWNTENRKPKTE